MQQHLPKSKMPVSMKNITFKALYDLIDRLKHENNADYQVLLFTANGTIIGDLIPCSNENEMIKYADDPADFALDISALFGVLNREWDLGEGEEAAFSDGYFLNLENVTVFSSHTNEKSFDLKQLIVFLDQIIGFSLVTRESFKND